MQLTTAQQLEAAQQQRSGLQGCFGAPAARRPTPWRFLSACILRCWCWRSPFWRTARQQSRRACCLGHACTSTKCQSTLRSPPPARSACTLAPSCSTDCSGGACPMETGVTPSWCMLIIMSRCKPQHLQHATGSGSHLGYARGASLSVTDVHGVIMPQYPGSTFRAMFINQPISSLWLCMRRPACEQDHPERPLPGEPTCSLAGHGSTAAVLGFHAQGTWHAARYGMWACAHEALRLITSSATQPIVATGLQGMWHSQQGMCRSQQWRNQQGMCHSQQP